jgi:enoyl-CoA hydratase
MTKRVLSQAPHWPAEEIWARQRDILEQVIASSDAKEGALAFSQKRAPAWTGS